MNHENAERAGNAYGSVPIMEWLLASESLEGFLQVLADAALDLSQTEGIGVMRERDHRPLTVVSAGPAAPALHEKQYGHEAPACRPAVLAKRSSSTTCWGDPQPFAAALGSAPRCPCRSPTGPRRWAPSTSTPVRPAFARPRTGRSCGRPPARSALCLPGGRRARPRAVRADAAALPQAERPPDDARGAAWTAIDP